MKCGEGLVIKHQKQKELLKTIDQVNRLLRRISINNSHHGRSTYRLLSIIDELKVIDTRELAERLDIRPSSLNERLAQLESGNLIQRYRDESDQRSFNVELSSLGKEHLSKLILDQEHFEQSLEEILDDDKTVILIELLRKLVEGLRPLTEQNDHHDHKRKHHHR